MTNELTTEEQITECFEQALEIVKERWSLFEQKEDGTRTTWDNAHCVKYTAWGALKLVLENQNIIIQRRCLRLLKPDNEECSKIFLLKTQDEAITYFKQMIKSRFFLV